MKTAQKQGDRRQPKRKRHAGGRPLLHGIKLEPFAFRMPPAMRDAIAALADSASATAGEDEPSVFENSVLLLAVSEWLARKQRPARVRRAALALNFAPVKSERRKGRR